MRKVAVSLSTFKVFLPLFGASCVLYSAAKNESNYLVEIETATKPWPSLQITFLSG